MHYVANGYGVVFNATHDTAIANAFPILYWNSSSHTWKSISDVAIDTIQSIADLYPTNCIGQSYPGIAVSDDGQYVFATWTGPEMTDGAIDTATMGMTIISDGIINASQCLIGERLRRIFGFVWPLELWQVQKAVWDDSSS